MINMTQSSQGDHIIDDFDSAIEEFANSTIESTADKNSPLKGQELSDTHRSTNQREDSDETPIRRKDVYSSVSVSYDRIIIDDFDSPVSEIDDPKPNEINPSEKIIEPSPILDQNL